MGHHRRNAISSFSPKQTNERTSDLERPVWCLEQPPTYCHIAHRPPSHSNYPMQFLRSRRAMELCLNLRSRDQACRRRNRRLRQTSAIYRQRQTLRSSRLFFVQMAHIAPAVEAQQGSDERDPALVLVEMTISHIIKLYCYKCLPALSFISGPSS